MTFCGSPLSRSLLGVKRTWLIAAHMSANDPKRTLVSSFVCQSGRLVCKPYSFNACSGGSDCPREAPRSLVATLGKVISKVQPFELVLVSRKSPP